MGYESHTTLLGAGDISTPAGTSIGDVLVLILARNGAGTPVSPDGWTFQGTDRSGSFAADARLDIYTLAVTETPPPTYEVGNVARAALIRLSGVQSSPVDIAFTNGGDSSLSSLGLPSIDTVAGATKLAVIVRNNQNSNPGVWSYPSEFSDIFGIGDREEDRIHFAAAAKVSDTTGPAATPSFGMQNGGRLVAAYMALGADEFGVPTGVRAVTVDHQAIDVTCNPVTAADLYEFERQELDDEGGPAGSPHVTQELGPLRADSGLTPSTTYAYRVRAREAGTSDWSDWSAPVEATTDPAPPDPSSLSAERVGSTTDVELSWAAPALPDATHIDIHRRTPPTGAPFDPEDPATRIARIETGAPHEWTDTDAPATAAEYQVFAAAIPDD